MAHAYTPGLRVTEWARLTRERRLPLKGHVLVGQGDALEADTIVARCELPGNVQTVNLAARLSLDPVKVPAALLKPLGTQVAKDEPIADSRSLFGLVRTVATAPAKGTLESVSSVTGQLILREPPIPVEVNAFVRGAVAEVLPDEGVLVETRAAFLQGIFGVGGETFGPIAIVARGPDAALEAADLTAAHRGQVVVAGAYVPYAVLMRARELGVAAVVVGGFDDRDLRQLLGRDLGVAITGSEELGLTLVLTEGFGHIRMAERTWRLLAAHQGEQASVSGATQIRAGVMRPEILIPRAEGAEQRHPGGESGLEVGSPLRIIREPYFGRLGQVIELPPELQVLETEAAVRVVVVEFDDDHARAIIPRANVELIAE
ncbi:MAG: hypothetical protein A2W00_06545 [Candidatus Eisenbacteria bacterium RBG_16_71_46]|nr:MAG: hypothetical protein A2W00_06545 [Candidatus Eisenbacteria bacterium RBG_16_71_46]OGF22302.1 MAG: hypothetical protein A2V63_04330 [Candidatus Eisenbacteria bacterium RBG_19FT_COMBO_70_11]